ncbi:MAG: 7-carboxy-7-deazaguanine synthase [Chloroflexi bacterium]|nr:7-carboxy-7-deazaguanine synthase [Chloroflexota bacterium]
MSYRVKEMYYTLQGEGVHTGRPAVFLRFEGCNLWTGREEDRASTVCPFCDTDFVGTDGPGGGVLATAGALVSRARSLWPDAGGSRPFIVCTGGEPLLQLDESLVEGLHGAGFEVAIETNGTLLPPAGIDWICMSPKAGAKLVLRKGHELKFVFPQRGIEPEECLDMEFEHFCLQPMSGPDLAENTRKAIEYCLRNPLWRLSLQIHKILGIP